MRMPEYRRRRLRHIAHREPHAGNRPFIVKLIHLVIVIVSPGTLFTVVDLPAVAACLVGEVRVVYPFPSVLSDDSP